MTDCVARIDDCMIISSHLIATMFMLAKLSVTGSGSEEGCAFQVFS